jgi:mono/diheme cytochrome c family protein
MTISALSFKAMLLGGLTVCIAAASAVAGAQQDANKNKADTRDIQRGRYLAQIAGCNDCHTPGYAMSGGKVAEAQWLTGDKLGWRGPWGTTYPTNLRLYMAGMSEAQWVKRAKTIQTRPPMPWFALHDMSERDLRAIHRFTRSLGPAGEPAPVFVPPDQTPQGPYVQFPAAPK